MENMEQVPPQENEGEELIMEPDKGQVRTKEDVEEERQGNIETDAWREQK